MLERLRSRYTIVSIVDQQLLDQVDDLRAGLGDQFRNAGSLHAPQTELGEVHVARVPLELIEQLLVGGAEDVMDLVHLVKLVVAWEEGEQGNDFEHDAANAPQVHLVAVVSVSKEAFGCTVPPGGDVLGVGLLGVDAATRSEVSQLHLVLHQQNVLWLDIPMENAVTMHVIYSFHQLVHVVLDTLLR